MLTKEERLELWNDYEKLSAMINDRNLSLDYKRFVLAEELNEIVNTLRDDALKKMMEEKELEAFKRRLRNNRIRF